MSLTTEMFFAIAFLGSCIWLLICLVPGEIARRNHHQHPQGVQMLGVIGFLVPPCWLAALIWSIVGGQPSKRRGQAIPYPRHSGGTSQQEDDGEAIEFEIVGTDKSGNRVKWTMLAEDADAARFAAFEREVTVIILRRLGGVGSSRPIRRAGQISWDDDETPRSAARPK